MDSTRERAAPVKLRQPTDFLILEALAEEGRNVATNLAHHTGKSRKNVNTRLPVLADYGLVEKIGPSDHSGLYEVTRRGRIALMYRDQYDDVEDFESLLERPERGDADPSAVGTNPGATAMVRGGDSEDDDEE